MKIKYYKVFTMLCIVLFIVSPKPLVAQERSYPSNVEAALQKAGNNRKELEKAIEHYKKQADSLKLKAVYFLISNMDIHVSANYYWADSLNHPIPFNELAYPDFKASLAAFDELKKQKPGIHPVSVRYRDIDSIKCEFLISNVDQAFETWKLPWARQVPFNLFCEYILPYRLSIEPFQLWRENYIPKYSEVLKKDNASSTKTVCASLKKEVRNNFYNTYNIESRKEPLPRLGPMQLLFRQKGPCEDLVGLAVYAMRSQGIPCTEDIAVYWATASGTHFWNVYFNEEAKPIPMDVTTHDTLAYKLIREPAKVIRVTYAKQPEAIASKVSVEDIPEGFMRWKNYIDVTEQYWKVKNVVCQLYPTNTSSKVAYACAYNYSTWRPSWWGNIESNEVEFSNMSQGAVYLPMYYMQGRLVPAGNPVAIPYGSEPFEIIADTLHRQTITLKEQDKYLAYRPNSHYKLYYWENQWKLLSDKVAGFERQLDFENVPRNALLLMVPDYSQRKERPFLMNEKGERVWW